MKTITLQLDEETARQILTDRQEVLAGKMDEKRIISEEIDELERFISNLKSQLANGDSTPARSPSGENKTKIENYLKGLAGNKGAKMSDIVKALGIGVSSVNFTLTNEKNKGLFEKVGKLWRIKQ